MHGGCRGPWERWRKDVSLVYSRRALRTPRRRPPSHGPGRRLSLVVVGASVPVLVVGYALMTTHTERAVNTASVSYAAAAGPDAGGWGRGGYMMMPGPASSSSAQGSAAQGSVANAANAGATSQNWAGYTSAGAAGTFTSVSAAWAEPAVTCTATDTFSSFWVGLDGDGTNSVEQTGTEADCNGGNAVYQGWFEMFPAAPVFFDNPVQPGDAMSASVVANGGGAFTLTLTDSTQGWTQTTNQTSNIAQLRVGRGHRGGAQQRERDRAAAVELRHRELQHRHGRQHGVRQREPQCPDHGVGQQRHRGHALGADRRQRLLGDLEQRRRPGRRTARAVPCCYRAVPCCHRT